MTRLTLLGIILLLAPTLPVQGQAQDDAARTSSALLDGADRFNRGDFGSVVTALIPVVEQNPLDWRARALLVLTYRATNRTAEADAEFDRVRISAPADVITVLQSSSGATPPAGWVDALARRALAPEQAGTRADPLSIYTLCVTAVYAELIPTIPRPIESMARARMACDEMRTRLEEQVRAKAGDRAPEILLAVDMEILNALRAAAASK
jgi:hypothetical protein